MNIKGELVAANLVDAMGCNGRSDVEVVEEFLEEAELEVLNHLAADLFTNPGRTTVASIRRELLRLVNEAWEAQS